MSMERYRCLNRDAIKYIAMFTMLLNHISTIFLKEGTFIRELLINIGYFTAITMCYFLVEGFYATSSRRKYAQRLLIFAFISEVPFCLAFTESGMIQYIRLNMMFTLFLCFIILIILDSNMTEQNKKICIAVLITASAACDWPLMAPVYTCLFYFAGNSREGLKKTFRIITVSYGALCFCDNLNRLTIAGNIISTLEAMTAVAASGYCIMYLYNGKRIQVGRKFSKWFFYLFYPAHLMVLGILRIVLNY